MDKQYTYEIDFWHIKELPNGTILFKVRDENAEVAGFAVASSSSSFDVILFGDIEFSDGNPKSNLSDQMEKFCKVYYAQKSED